MSHSLWPRFGLVVLLSSSQHRKLSFSKRSETFKKVVQFATPLDCYQHLRLLTVKVFYESVADCNTPNCRTMPVIQSFCHEIIESQD